MTQITIPIKVNSASHKLLTEGVKRFGQNYRHQWKGKYYKIVDWKPSVRGEFSLVLESVL
ncbi:hypothetical protein NVP1124O_58 [Vibrio phage 1.124.O._10N.286.49.B1]|nr:hypothetical protein NVP1124O_58 [Vibrio phage 1.124.O._10N.286.49.B1]